MIRVNRLGLTKEQKVSALGLGNISNKKKEIIDNNDFLPVVLINPSEEPKNAIISLDDCNESKIEKIYLGRDYDKEFQNYNVANIVIAKRSIARIPLRIKRGYDPSGFQDEDGELQFLPSNGVVKLNYIDNDDTDYEEGEDKYDIKDASNGDVFVLEIDASKLERGTKFSLSVFATDKKEFWGQTSKRKGICGKFNLKVVENDVFMEDDKERVIKLNEELVNGFWNIIWGSFDKVCFRVADKELSELLKTNLVLSNYDGIGGVDRIESHKKNGFVNSSKIFNQDIIWKTEDEGEYKFKPNAFKRGYENVFLEFINNGIKNKIGYHFYYFSLLDDFHILIIIVNNHNPCNPSFIILDQLKIRKWQNIKQINTEMLTITKNNYNGACDHANRKDYNSTIRLWKIER
jgi:hypothetical protein